MIDRTKKLPARFYLNAAGRNPVREWILELTRSRPAHGRQGYSEGRIRLAARTTALRSARQGLVGGTLRARQQPNRAGDFLHGRRHHDLAARLHQEDAEDAASG